MFPQFLVKKSFQSHKFANYSLSKKALRIFIIYQYDSSQTFEWYSILASEIMWQDYTIDSK